MPVMPQQYQQPQMPTELPPIQTVQTSVMNYTHQTSEVAPAPVQHQYHAPMQMQQPIQQQQYQVQQQAPVQQPVQMQQPVQAQPVQMQQPVQQPVQMQEQAATPIMPVAPNPSEATVSPRDMLMAKARAFKESQDLKSRHHQPEQLSMNVDQEQQSLEEARKMAREVLSSPFSGQNLEVPAFIRKKQGFDLNKE